MIDIVVPEEQEGTKAVVKSWLKKIGEPVRLNDPLVELETDKVAVEIAATSDGVLSEILFQDGVEVGPGTVLGRIAENAANVAKPSIADREPPIAASAPRAPSADTSGPLPPGIRKLLADQGLDAAEVPKRGMRLTREDIEAEVARRTLRAPSGPTSVGPTPGVKSVPHDSMRKRIAEHLAESVSRAPHVTAVFESDLSAIMAHRAANKAAFARAQANLTLTAYFVWASARAMDVTPAVNGRWYDDRIDIYVNANIGVGTALGEKGLIVPVIHRAQSLSLLEIAKRLTELTEKARAGKLAQEDVRGGTFSISNHGVSGSLLAAPIIINQPQSAILGVGAVRKRAVVRGDDDRIEVRPMAYVTLTIDHRVIDAFQTNAWLSRFVNILETWPVDVAV